MSVSDVLAEYDRIRERNKAEEIRRRREVCEKNPELREILDSIKKLMLRRIEYAFIDNDSINNQIKELKSRQKNRLIKSGFSPDYLEPVYECSACRDTGTLGSGAQCACFKKRVLEDKLREASLIDEEVSFERYDPSRFDTTPIENGKSQREITLKIKQICEDYANAFPDCLPYFLMSGATGLGKTYLSKCIMRRVIERGYTAAYYTAYRLNSLFHAHRLGEGVDLDPLLSVPLLVIDDIGTEPVTRNVTKEYLFDLLNERSSLCTVIVTNLPFHEIKERYGDRIHSRLMDARHSKKILFKGKDIRY